MPGVTHFATSSTESVFQEDLLDDVFYEEPMPTSAVVTAVDEFPSLRLRHKREAASDRLEADSDSARPAHPLAALYYEMPSVSDDRCVEWCFIIIIVIIETFVTRLIQLKTNTSAKIE